MAYLMKDGIYVMDANGSNRRRVYWGELVFRRPGKTGFEWGKASGGAVGMAVLSPDGNKIVFIRNDGLWVMDVNGGGLQQVIVSTGNIHYVAWAPDSNQVLCQDGGGAFYIVKISGDIPQHVGGGLHGADWSPDGGWFALRRGGLAKRAVSGGPEFVLDPSTGCGAYPAWSPDGTRIAYTKNGDIFVINADGSGQTRLTDHPAGDWGPRWSPDGNKIVFTTDRDGNKEIYVMNPDGSNQVNLTNSADDEWQPTWAP
jgi:TolB protein